MGPYGNNGYIVHSPATKEGVIIDAPAEPEKLLVALGSIKVTAIILTHGHQDHWLGLEKLRAVTGAPVAIHPDDAERLPTPADSSLKDGDVFAVGKSRLRVLHTPGHTPGSVCLLVGVSLFSGDTLFPGGPGSSKTPQALQQLIRSITQRLYTLPDDTQVYPGHGLGTTISRSKEEYAAFASRPHPPELCGDVRWLES
jgi:glyoxylase-like metal-dependent hydrolase (beta-lactamase superfamily II)